MTALVATIGAQAANPFFGKYKTYRQTPPFQEIKTEHFLPAFEEAFKQQNAEIEKIVQNKAEATFANTIEAFDYSGEMIQKIYAVYSTFINNKMDDEMMELSSKVAPMITEHTNNIMLNEKLFERIQSVYNQKHALSLNAEEQKLLENIYLDFVRNGATLTGTNREKYRELSSKLSSLTLTFGQNALKATYAYSKLITDSSLLAGIPEDDLTTAKEKAKEKNQEGWLFDLSAPSYSAVRKYADNRTLREELYKAYSARAVNGEYNNLENIRKIVNTRLEIAKLLGFEDYASYVLQRKMAKDEQTVYQLLDRLRDAYLPVAKEEIATMKGFAIGYEQKNIQLEPWDWNYYANKLQSLQYDINDEMLRPYFSLEKVKEGVFGLATDLYGLTFKENKKIQVWNKDVTAYEVFDKDGKYMAILYTDFFPRPEKGSGAWMDDIMPQCKINGRDQRPFITLTMNFTTPTAEKPSLLTFYEVTTFLHEFGHALHGILSDVTYPSLSGTSVDRDFVEMPSQLMENWAYEKEFLDKFAVHYQTGEKIPMDLVEKVKASQNFLVGYDCCRQLCFGYLDMGWHSIKEPFTGDIQTFEKSTYEQVAFFPTLDSSCIGAAFTHIFDGGYAAGYYGYKWAEALSADIYDYYTEKAVFDTERAASFRENILSKGGTEDARILYKRFRGKEAGSIEALLRHNGIQ